MTEYLFWKIDREHPRTASTEDSSIRVVLWTPRLFRMKPRGVPGRAILVYWLFHYLRVFTNRSYTFLLMYRDGELLHYAAAYPKYFRFPFMARNDLQIGYVWTAPSCRGQGLAARGVSLLANAIGTSNRSIWYVVNRSNKASIRVAQKAGFVNVGMGYKRRSRNILGLATYQIAQFCNTIAPEKAA